MSLGTPDRIMEAAGEIFAERGFHDATIREICQRANANVAAVHYHIGDKDELYRAVFQHTIKIAMEKHPLPAVAGSPEEQLRAHVRALLFRILDEGRPSWHGKLIAREMANPTPALENLVDQIRTNLGRLTDIVRQLLPDASAETIRHCALSIPGQCLFYFHCRTVVTRVFPEQGYTGTALEQLADHITQFSLAGIRSYRA